jgi:hypothetical protein
MTLLTRNALVRWLGHPPSGTARVTIGSGSIPQLAQSGQLRHGSEFSRNG